jgi:hypothetical protein
LPPNATDAPGTPPSKGRREKDDVSVAISSFLRPHRQYFGKKSIACGRRKGCQFGIRFLLRSRLNAVIPARMPTSRATPFPAPLA